MFEEKVLLVRGNAGEGGCRKIKQSLRGMLGSMRASVGADNLDLEIHAHNEDRSGCGRKGEDPHGTQMPGTLSSHSLKTCQIQ